MQNFIFAAKVSLWHFMKDATGKESRIECPAAAVNQESAEQFLKPGEKYSRSSTYVEFFSLSGKKASRSFPGEMYHIYDMISKTEGGKVQGTVESVNLEIPVTLRDGTIVKTRNVAVLEGETLNDATKAAGVIGGWTDSNTGETGIGKVMSLADAAKALTT